ncbi:MetQ/NlpA family ABC transporter substrate-binding protein [Caldibacillus lycopersici]|uniref:Lipoprotein n=1 Tax=Perspicuibacillus lycopersici TaxID=1325689 RepID=A0AAE3IR88_9BACI|nr:MetQ/NlpA family ABC transporter substrate-binding protein [Perspicuibacillus lycopersici]MCU9613115.1 MetQ/NlpA family ABC transporter substrate-binding protein [Perspicuibacillus lycopersici]
MKKIVLALLVLALAVFTTACSDSDTKKIKLAISGTDTRMWDYVAEKAKKEGIDIEIVSFNDYVLPNTALAEGEVNVNAFQTVAYFDQFIKEHDLDLVPLATTVIAPMAIFSDKVEDVADIPEGGEIAIPNDPSNGGRALLLLQEAGLITLADDYTNQLRNVETDIVDNPKNLKITPVVAAQTPRVLPDVAASVINNGIANDAGLNPLNDSIFHEDDTATDYINIIAVRAEDKDDETLKRIGELFQEDDTAEFIEKEYDGTLIPTFVPLENIGW